MSSTALNASAEGTTSSSSTSPTAGHAPPPGVTSLKLGMTSTGVSSKKGEIVAASPPLSPREQARRDKEFQDLVISDKIEIVGNKTLTQDFDGKQYTVYQISIGGIEFEKRYSEFRDFYDALITKTGYSFTGFPGKLSFNNMGAATIQKRTLALAEFLNDVNKSVGASPERAVLLDSFFLSANKLLVMKVATALLQSVVTYVPEVKAGIDAAVAVAKVASNFPVDQLSFMTDVTPVWSAMQAWGDEVFSLASNQPEKRQRKKVLDGCYLYSLAILLSRRFEEPDSSEQLATDLITQLTNKDNAFFEDTSLFTTDRFWAPRKKLTKLRDDLEHHIEEHPKPEKAKHYSKKLTKLLTKSVAAMLPTTAPPCEFCIVTGGDLGRRETMAFSSFEFAIVVESKHKLHHNHEFFDNLSHLLNVQLVNLGEAIKSRGGGFLNPFAHITSGKTIQVMLHKRFYLISGFRFDTSAVSPAIDLEEFVTTPKKLVKSLSPNAAVGGDVDVRNALLFTRFVAGSHSVYDEFTKLKVAEETKHFGDQHARFIAGVSELQDLTEDFRMVKPERNDYIVDVKTDLFKPFHSVIDVVTRILFTPEELSKNESHTWKHLKLLKQHGYLEESSYQVLKETFDSIIFLRQKIQLFYGSEEERVFPEDADEGRYDPKFKIDEKVAVTLEKIISVNLALLDFVRELEKEKEMISKVENGKWDVNSSQAINVAFKNVGQLINCRVIEASALVSYLREEFVLAVEGFEKALAAIGEPIGNSFLNRERTKTLWRLIGISLLSVLEGKQKFKEGEAPTLERRQELGKRARAVFESLQTLLEQPEETNNNSRVGEEVVFASLQLARLGLVEMSRSVADVLEETNSLLEKANSLITTSTRFLPVLLMIRGEALERYFEANIAKKKENKAAIDTAYGDFVQAQDFFGVTRRFSWQCDAILHLINTCKLNDKDKEGGKWKIQLEDIYLRYDVREKNKVFIEAIKTCSLALTPLLKDYVSDLVRDHLKKELIKQAKKNLHHAVKCSIQ